MLVRFGWFGAFTTLMLVASSSAQAQRPSITDAPYADRHVLNDGERGEREIARLGQGSWEARTGRFLVASRGLKDLRFRESVILLVDHGSTASMGVMINRPSDTTLFTILPDIEALENRPDVA